MISKQWSPWDDNKTVRVTNLHGGMQLLDDTGKVIWEFETLKEAIESRQDWIDKQNAANN